MYQESSLRPEFRLKHCEGQREKKHGLEVHNKIRKYLLLLCLLPFLYGCLAGDPNTMFEYTLTCLYWTKGVGFSQYVTTGLSQGSYLSSIQCPVMDLNHPTVFPEDVTLLWRSLDATVFPLYQQPGQETHEG